MLSGSPCCSRWQDVRSGDCANPTFRQHCWRKRWWWDEGKFQVEISPPSLSRDGNDVGGGILLAARAKVVPLSSRMPLKYIFLSVLFRCIAFHDYTFAPRCTHLTLFHPIDFISSGTYHLFYSYTRLDVKKLEREPCFNLFLKKLSVPRRLYFIRDTVQIFIFFPVERRVSSCLVKMLDTCIVHCSTCDLVCNLPSSWAIPFLIKLWSSVLIIFMEYFIYRSLEQKFDILKISNYVLFIRVVGDEAISVYPSASFNVKFQSIINEGDINISCIFCVRANIFIIVNTVEKEFEQTLI